MHGHAPLLLNEAALALYPADASGHALTSQAIWIGACAEQLSLSQDLNEIDVTPSGAAYPVSRMVPRLQEIGINRLWALRRSDLRDFELDPEGIFILSLLWSAIREDFWYKRTYYGVRPRSVHLESDGLVQFYSDQRFSAQRFVVTQGFGAYAPSSVITESEEQAFFCRAGKLASGDYFLGHYKWAVARQAISAKVIAKASVGSATDLTLMVNGVSSGYELTIPAGAEDEEVTGEVDLSGLSLAPNLPIRWLVNGTPGDPDYQASQAGIVMRFERA